MSKVVQSNAVSVLKDETRGAWPDGCTRYIGCDYSVVVASEFVTLLDGGNDCGIIPAGTVFPTAAAPEGVIVYDTVKLNTPEFGLIWITQASYTALKNACNACCTE